MQARNDQLSQLTSMLVDLAASALNNQFESEADQRYWYGVSQGLIMALNEVENVMDTTAKTESRLQ